MHISVATANLYFHPFAQALGIIAEAGVRYIELDLYWERKTWAMAQHLKSVSIKEACRLIHQSGLVVSSIHDGGGVLENAGSIQGFINPQLDDFLDGLGYSPGCVVFHTPHVEGERDGRWFDHLADKVAQTATAYQSGDTLVTLENMPPFSGYGVPLLTPDALLAFVSRYDLHVTLDTTHYAQMGTDTVAAATVLRGLVKTVHLSDYVDGQTHVFVGDGVLDLARCLQAFDLSTLHAVTLECALAHLGENARELEPSVIVDRLRMAQTRLEGWLSTAP